MKAYILETPIGLLVLNQKGIIMNKFLTKSLKDEDLLDFLHYNQKIWDVPAFSEFIKEMQSEDFDLITESKAMKILLETNYRGKIEASPLDDFFLDQRVIIPQLLTKFGLMHTTEELIKISRANAKRMSRDLVRESGQNPDVHIINAVGVLENTSKFINSYAIQLREWYGSHFPELTDNLVNDIELYSKIVYLFEHRDEITAEKLIKELQVKDEYAHEIEYQAINSMGGDLTESQLNAIRLFSKNILDLIEFRDHLEKSVNKILQEICPNLYTILGMQLTGKLITHAGGLENLAKMASSTIQVLGAEKALFRALRKKTDSPKHGVIYTWPQIRSAKYWQRGKISRLLSGKISICAKVDFFKGEFIGDKIQEELERKIKKIKEKFPDPPKKQKKSKSTYNSSQKKKDIARKKAQQFSKSKYKSGVKTPRRK